MSILVRHILKKPIKIYDGFCFMIGFPHYLSKAVPYSQGEHRTTEPSRPFLFSIDQLSLNRKTFEP